MAVNGVNGHNSSALCGVKEFVDQKYDYVVVGGGTAGLCVAARLSENPDVKVGVLEAGADRMVRVFLRVENTLGMLICALGRSSRLYAFGLSNNDWTRKIRLVMCTLPP